MKQQEWLKILSALKLNYLKSFDMKECMLKIQEMLMKKLAAEVNHFKRLTVIFELFITDFDERVKKITKIIQMLQYWWWTAFCSWNLQEKMNVCNATVYQVKQWQK